MTETGLRERSKARRRAAIQDAALRLFAERGYDGATVADVAAAAEVAPRTVLLYFPTKLDMAMSASNAAADRLTAAFSARLDGATTLDVFGAWLRHEVESNAEVLALQRAMFEANPHLRGVQSAATERARQVAAAAIAAEMERPVHDIGVVLAGGAIAGVISAILSFDPRTNDLDAAFATATRLLQAAVDAVRMTGEHDQPTTRHRSPLP